MSVGGERRSRNSPASLEQLRTLRAEATQLPSIDAFVGVVCMTAASEMKLGAVWVRRLAGCGLMGPLLRCEGLVGL